VSNDQAAETNGQSALSGNEAPTPDVPHAPDIQVLKGRPNDDEVAALVAVLSSAVGGGAAPPPQVFSQWGLPVDKLRYSIHSWQRMSLQQRTHMRGK
jgi:Acyl-CoA carboxylase epsilon subunit